MELLQDILRGCNRTASLLFKIQFYEPLGIAFLGDRKSMGFQAVVQGEAFIRGEGADLPLRLRAGDLIFYVRNFAHDVAFDQATPVHLVASALPFPAAIGRGRAPVLTLLNGGYAFADVPEHPLFVGLPPFFVLHASAIARDAPLHTAIKLVAAELQDKAAVMDNDVKPLLLDVVFQYVLRHWVGRHAPTGSWQLVLDDPPIYRALKAIHSDIRREWTVDTLARESGLSRATFALRFHQRLGDSPRRYLARVRIQYATDMLQSTSRSLTDIAQQVGYAHAFALSKAFKRVRGFAPSEYRRTLDSYDEAKHHRGTLLPSHPGS